MSIGPFGDMYVVIGHKNEMRADKKWQTVTFKTNYFTPAAYNTLQEAKEFVSKVKNAYSADIVRLWNPIDREKLLALAEVLSTPEPDACCARCPLRKWCESELYNGHRITCFECKTWHAADVIREACGEEPKDET